MDSKKILTADILDILFEGRNKEYGAYDLRKTYKRRLITALVVMAGLCILILLLSLVQPKSNKKATVLIQDVQLANVEEKKKDEPPPPPPPPKQEPPKVEIAKFTPPKIVK